MRPYGLVPKICKNMGISRDSFYNRVKRGWHIDEKALELLEPRRAKVVAEERAMSELNKVLRGWGRVV